jgi:hypothetical protein
MDSAQRPSVSSPIEYDREGLGDRSQGPQFQVCACGKLMVRAVADSMRTRVITHIHTGILLTQSCVLFVLHVLFAWHTHSPTRQQR